MIEIIATYLLTIILSFTLASILGVRFFSALTLSILTGIIIYTLVSPKELFDFSGDKRKIFMDNVIFFLTSIVLLFYIILCIVNDTKIKTYRKKT